MASKYDWDFIRPLDQTASIQAMTQGNQQVQTGLQGISDAISGYATDIKQRNTDEILNALYQAQTTADLPDAMNAANALRQKYGRSVDQGMLRREIDARGTTLNQRDVQALQLQNAQAQQAALPAVRDMAIARMRAAGATPDEIAAVGAMQGIDPSALAANAVSDAQYRQKYNRGVVEFEKTFNAGRADAKWQQNHLTTEANRAQANNDRNYNLQAIGTASTIAGNLEQPGGSYWVEGPDGLVEVSTSGVSKGQAFGAALGLVGGEGGSSYNVASKFGNGTLNRSQAGIRGFRNNNPGNLNYAGQRGAKRENGNGRFASFNTPEEGLAAMGRQLDLHFKGTSTIAKSRYGGKSMDTIEKIISAWAPPEDGNNTEKYIADVSKSLGIGKNQKLDLNDTKLKASLMHSIIQSENGSVPYTQAQLYAGAGGKAGSSSAQASSAIGLPTSGVASKTMSGNINEYRNAITKLNNDYTKAQAAAQSTGGLANSGKNIDTWLASKGEFSLSGGSTNPVFTDAADIAAMARANPAFMKLDGKSQNAILEGTYGFVNSAGTMQRVKNSEITKFIKNETDTAVRNGANQHKAALEAQFETSYQKIANSFTDAGQQPPSREAVRNILNPQNKQTQQKSTQPPAQTADQIKKQQEADKAKREAAEAAKRKADGQGYIDRINNLDRERKEKDAREKAAKDKAKADEAARAKAKREEQERIRKATNIAQGNMSRGGIALRPGSTMSNIQSMTPQQINEFLKNRR